MQLMVMVVQIASTVYSKKVDYPLLYCLFLKRMTIARDTLESQYLEVRLGAKDHQ